MNTWAEDYLEKKPGLSAFQIQLLKEGPKGLSQAWALGAMKRDWDKHFKTRIVENTLDES